MAFAAGAWVPGRTGRRRRSPHRRAARRRRGHGGAIRETIEETGSARLVPRPMTRRSRSCGGMPTRSRSPPVRHLDAGARRGAADADRRCVQFSESGASIQSSSSRKRRGASDPRSVRTKQFAPSGRTRRTSSLRSRRRAQRFPNPPQPRAAAGSGRSRRPAPTPRGYGHDHQSLGEERGGCLHVCIRRDRLSGDLRAAGDGAAALMRRGPFPAAVLRAARSGPVAGELR